MGTEPMMDGQELDDWRARDVGMASLAEVMGDVERQIAEGDVERFRPVPTGFNPLDDVINGGLRRGDLMVVGGAFGVGKTIFGLQLTRNVVLDNPNARAIFICYEHDRAHLMSRLLCLESAEQGAGREALTLRKLDTLSLDGANGGGLISKLRGMPRYASALNALESYSDRLTLVKASGAHSTLEHIRDWVEEVAAEEPAQLLVVVDYLQKIPVYGFESEAEITTHQVQTLKDLAMAHGIQIMAIAASDRSGLKAKRMRLTDFRGSSAIQYEADVGLVLNNKYAIVSREHMIYNTTKAEAMRNWVVMTVEKNRSGRNAVDMEYELDAKHFRMVPRGDFVRERLIDEKVVLE